MAKRKEAKIKLAKFPKITEQLDKIEGVEKTFWDFNKAKLTVYYDEKYLASQMNVRIQDYLVRRQLQDSVREIKFLSTKEGTFTKPKIELISRRPTRLGRRVITRITPKTPKLRR